MGNILIIDDDRDLCETLGDLIEVEGHHVQSVHTVADSFRILTRIKPDVVLLDMHLPGGSGVLVLSFARKLSRLAGTHFIIISGNAELAQKTAVEWEADTWLAKPIRPADLRRVINASAEAVN